MIGRPPTKDAPPFGQRLAALRRAKGLTQRELADRIETTRAMVDYYERRAVNPTLEVVDRVARALDVSPAELLGVEAPTPAKRGPAGKLRVLFDEVSRLPRRQQEKIAEVVAALVSQYEQSRERDA
jgi:transcriptional regulator with XRE-family HTH domain